VVPNLGVMPPRRETEPIEGVKRLHEDLFNFYFINFKKAYNLTLAVYNITFGERKHILCYSL